MLFRSVSQSRYPELSYFVARSVNFLERFSEIPKPLNSEFISFLYTFKFSASFAFSASTSSSLALRLFLNCSLCHSTTLLAFESSVKSSLAIFIRASISFLELPCC